MDDSKPSRRSLVHRDEFTPTPGRLYDVTQTLLPENAWWKTPGVIMRTARLFLTLGTLCLFVVGCSGLPSAKPFAGAAPDPASLLPFEDPSGMKTLLPQGWAHKETVAGEGVHTATFTSDEGGMSIVLQCLSGMSGAFTSEAGLRNIGLEAIGQYQMENAGWGMFPAGTHYVSADGFNPHFEAYTVSVPADGSRVQLATLIGWRLDNLGQCKYTMQGFAPASKHQELATAWLAVLHNLY